MEDDKHSIDILKCGDLSFDNLMIHCQTAFRNSPLPADKTRDIDLEWEKDEIKYEAAADYDSGRWERFKTFYIDKIKDLNEDGLIKGKANSVRELEAKFDDLETRFTAKEYDIDMLNSNQMEIDRALHVGGDIPSMIGSSPGTTSNLTTTINSHQIQEMVNKAFEARFAERHNQHQTGSYSHNQQPGTTTQRPGTPAPDMNLRHDSPGCDHHKDNHKKEATKDNPMGGNTKRDHLWMKWCSPVDHKAYEQPT
jgi:hypothetical protein